MRLLPRLRRTWPRRSGLGRSDRTTAVLGLGQLCCVAQVDLVPTAFGTWAVRDLGPVACIRELIGLFFLALYSLVFVLVSSVAWSACKCWA